MGDALVGIVPRAYPVHTSSVRGALMLKRLLRLTEGSDERSSEHLTTLWRCRRAVPNEVIVLRAMGYAELILSVWFVFGVVSAGLAAWLASRFRKQRKTGSPVMNLIRFALALSVVLVASGALPALVKAFGAVGGENVDPSQKARVLAEGIAEAMNCTAVGLAAWGRKHHSCYPHRATA